MKKLLTYVLCSLLACGSLSGQQIDKKVAENTAFTINSTADATDGSEYQWLENGKLLDNATTASLTFDSGKARGVYTYIRQSKSASCVDWQSSNAYTVQVGTALMVNGITWADVNVHASKTWAERPDMPTNFFQWNSTQALAATGGAVTMPSSVDTWAIWQNNPCPDGWRLPTSEEFTALANTCIDNNLFGSWAAANARGNAVTGRFFGPKCKTCSLPDNMDGCIFLPAVGYRHYSGGTLGGYQRQLLDEYTG